MRINANTKRMDSRIMSSMQMILSFMLRMPMEPKGPNRIGLMRKLC
jgi:hypothetical protein